MKSDGGQLNAACAGMRRARDCRHHAQETAPMSRSIAVLITAALCACLATACSPNNPQAPQPRDAPQPQSESSVVLNSPLGPLIKDRDKAKAVQKIVDKQAAQQKAAIDAQSH
jgi:hypothetical protein